MENETKNNYLPLFRKYRPQSFKDVIGQEFTVRALENAIKLNKIANAYLFCGPRGTGKTSSARIFAKSLNCIEGPTVNPCQKCQSCLDVTNASGLDVIEIDAATNRGIDDAKELINKVQYAPMNGKYKIFIIDEVHMLSKEAFNALLKTFEEPPKNVIFILATTEPHKVIETIVSRCQRFDFRRITIDDIVKRLREISDIEKINIDDEALYTIAKNVSGGMRDSLALLDQASILGIENKITTMEKENALKNCVIGSIFYSDQTCSSGSLTPGKTPIGVVVYTNGEGHGQVMALNSIGNYEWGGYGTDISTLQNFSSVSAASQDLASCENTAKIIAAGDKSSYPAAWAAHEYKTEGTNVGDWCLPAAGILTSIYNNMELVNIGYGLASGSKIGTSSVVWSSSEYDGYDAWGFGFSFDNGVLNYVNFKSNSDEVRPVLEF